MDPVNLMSGVAASFQLADAILGKLETCRHEALAAFNHGNPPVRHSREPSFCPRPM